MARSSLKNIAKLLDISARNESPEKAFLSDLKRSIEMTADKGVHPASKTYKPSGMKCIRAMYYGITGEMPDEGESNYCMIGICNSGSDIHVRVQTAISEMKDNGIDCEYVDVAKYVKDHHLDYLNIVSKSGMETKLYHKDLNMSFLCDGIIRYNGHYYILELKTESLYKWGNRKEVNPEHYNQGIAYSLALGISEVMFVYINRDNLDMKSYIFPVTDDMRNGLVAKITECDDYVMRKEIPPIPEDFNKDVCRWCSYRQTCSAEVD